MLYGVGAELVQSKAQLLRGGRCDEEFRSIELDTRWNGLDEVGKLTPCKVK